jgi:hypothetical protein
MSDECKNCVASGRMELCMKVPCDIHHYWYVNALQAQIEELKGKGTTLLEAIKRETNWSNTKMNWEERIIQCEKEINILKEKNREESLRKEIDVFAELKLHNAELYGVLVTAEANAAWYKEKAEDIISMLEEKGYYELMKYAKKILGETK